MSERANLVSLFREVDRSVVDIGDRAEDVGVVLEPYRSGAAGWFERYRSNVDGTFDEGLLDVAEALRDMSTTSEGDIEPAKRVIAAAALARADPARFPLFPGDRGDDVTLLVEALVPVMPPDNRNADRGFELLQVLAGKDEEGNDDPTRKFDWSATLERAVELELLDAAVASEAAVCCGGTWTSVTVEGEAWPASVLETSFSTTEITLEQLSHYLSPENWPGCCSLWCAMTRLNPAGSPACYLEHISFGCPGPWRLRTCLEFVRNEITDGISVEYQRCLDPVHLPHADLVVTVDEGSIVAVQQGAQLRVTSTKRVSFRGPFDAPSFAMWACALGYGEAAREMAFRCARDKKAPPSQDWQVDPSPSGPSMGATMPTSGSPADPVDHLTEVAAQGIRSSAQAYKDFMTKLATKGTSSDEIVRAAAAMWTEPAVAMLRLCSPVSSLPSGPHTVQSGPFSAGAPFTQGRHIVLSGPLVSGFGHRIEVAALRAEPPVLPPGVTQFRIAAQVVGQRAGVYRGTVTIVDDLAAGGGGGAGTTGVTVPVWLQVP